MMKMQVCLTLGIALLFARGDTIVSAVFYNLRLVILRVSRNRDKKIIPNTGTENFINSNYLFVLIMYVDRRNQVCHHCM